MPNYRGAAVPTSNVWDVTALYDMDVTSPEFKELLIRLYQNLNLMANVLDVKDSGYYDIDEFTNGQLFFPNPNPPAGTHITPNYRPAIRKVINFGALPNGAVPGGLIKPVAHNVTFTANCTMTRIYGTATKPVAPYSYIGLDFSSGILNENIKLWADGTNVYVQTWIDYSMYTRCIIVMEYLKL